MPPSPDLGPKPENRTAIYCGLILLCLTANYLYVAQFGIYEDDYFYTIPAFQWSWADCWAQIRQHLLTWPQGRPIGHAGNDLISWISAQSNSLELGYALGAALLVTNTLLCYRLASTWFGPLGAFAAAAVYCLNPADTGKVILMHRTYLLLGCTFLLWALLCYRQRRYWVAYLAAALSLITYEVFFFPFLAAPLILLSWKEFSWRRVLAHGVTCGAILATAILIRVNTGDSRATQTIGSLNTVADKIGHAVILGPSTCLRMLFLRPLDALRFSTPGQWGAIIGVTLATLALFPLTSVRAAMARKGRETFLSLLLFSGGGLLLLALGYVLAFRPDNYPPVVTIGRLSGFNAPAGVALGLIFGAWVNALVTADHRRRWVVAATGLFLGLLVSFGLEVQRVDYVRNWQQQRAFWEQLLADSGEWSSGAVVLVQIEGSAGRPDTPGFPAAWMVNYPPLLAQHLILSPTTLTETPFLSPHVYGFDAGTPAVPVAGGLQVKTPPWSDASLWPVVRDGSFLYYNFVDGHLARKSAPVGIDVYTLIPKSPPSAALPALAKTRLYEILFGPKTPWPSIASARNYPP